MTNPALPSAFGKFAVIASFLLAPAAFAQDATAPVSTGDGTEIGQVDLQFTESGMAVAHITLHDVEPGQHAVHFHETGACDGPDFKSAGGHLAAGMDHGVMSANGPHPGDMPNITVPDSGMADITYFVPGLTKDLVMDEDGTAFIIHAASDDYQSQPAGDAGDRLGCAVIAAAK